MALAATLPGVVILILGLAVTNAKRYARQNEAEQSAAL
jgi:hypothetical protein